MERNVYRSSAGLVIYGEDQFSISDFHKKREERQWKHVRQIERAEVLNEVELFNLANRIKNCWAKERISLMEEGVYLVSPVWKCQSRYCLFCASREAARFRKKYVPRFSKLVADGYKIARFYGTIPNIPAINSATYEELLTYFSNLRRHKQFKTAFAGALVRAETTIDDSSWFHPHLHGTIACRPDQLGHLLNGKFESAWAKIASGKAEIDELKLNPVNPFEVKNELSRNISYVFKPAKIDDVNAFAEYIKATLDKRLVRAYGAIRQCKFEYKKAPAASVSSGMKRVKHVQEVSLLDDIMPYIGDPDVLVSRDYLDDDLAA